MPPRGLFILFYFALETTPFIPKGYVSKEKQKEEGRSNKGNPSLSTVRCAQDSGAGVPPYKIEMKRKDKNNLAFPSTLLHLFGFPGYPLVHPGRVRPVVIRSHSRQF